MALTALQPVENLCGGDSLRRGAISSVCAFTF